MRRPPAALDRMGRTADDGRGATGRMRLRVLGIAVASLSILAQAPPPPGQVEHVPPEQAVAILGRPVAAPDGKEIGRLIDVLVDNAGTPEAAVIDFGGFMGVGARKIAVHWSMLHFTPADPKRPITLELTPDQIKAAPEYKDPAGPAPVIVAPPAIAEQPGPPAPSGPR